MPDVLKGIQLYAKSRKLIWVIVFVIILGVLQVLSSDKELNIPGISTGINLPYRYIIGLVIAQVVVNSLETPFQGWESGDTGPLRKTKLLHLLLMAVFAGVITIVAEQFAQVSEPTNVLRGYVFWLALALLSVYFLDESVAWLLPLVYFSLMAFFSSGSQGLYPFWCIVGRTVYEPLSWIYTLGVLTVALLLHTRILSPMPRRQLV